jgi:hypothetical protein
MTSVVAIAIVSPKEFPNDRHKASEAPAIRPVESGFVAEKSPRTARLLADRHRPTLPLVPTVLRGNAVCDAPRRLPDIASAEDAERPGRHSHAERGNELKSFAISRLSGKTGGDQREVSERTLLAQHNHITTVVRHMFRSQRGLVVRSPRPSSESPPPPTRETTSNRSSRAFTMHRSAQNPLFSGIFYLLF